MEKEKGEREWRKKKEKKEKKDGERKKGAEPFCTGASASGAPIESPDREPR